MSQPHRMYCTARALVTLCAICLALLLTPAAAHGQEVGKRLHALSVGVRGGVGSGGVTIRPYQPTHSALLYDIGLRAALHSSKNLAMVLEFNFRRTGYTSSYPTPHSSTPPSLEASLYAAQQDWLTLPLLMEGRVHIGPVSINVFAGPEGDLLLTERAGKAGVLTKQPLHSSLHQRLGMSILGGIGVGLNTRIGSFVVEYRTFYRLTSLYAGAQLPKLDMPRSNMRGQEASLSYYYTFTFGNQP